jgi:starvation-inducible DNA-binding protein
LQQLSVDHFLWSWVAFEQISKISDDESGPLPARKMVQILTDDHEAVAKQGNELISALDDADDPATADMVTDAVKRHQKNAWMLRSSQDASK